MWSFRVQIKKREILFFRSLFFHARCLARTYLYICFLALFLFSCCVYTTHSQRTASQIRTKAVPWQCGVWWWCRLICLPSHLPLPLSISISISVVGHSTLSSFTSAAQLCIMLVSRACLSALSQRAFISHSASHFCLPRPLYPVCTPLRPLLSVCLSPTPHHHRIRRSPLPLHRFVITKIASTDIQTKSWRSLSLLFLRREERLSLWCIDPSFVVNFVVWSLLDVMSSSKE